MQSPMPDTEEETNVTQACTEPHAGLLSTHSHQPRPANSLCSVLSTRALPSKSGALAARIRSTPPAACSRRLQLNICGACQTKGTGETGLLPPQGASSGSPVSTEVKWRGEEEPRPRDLEQAGCGVSAWEAAGGTSRCTGHMKDSVWAFSSLGLSGWLL